MLPPGHKIGRGHWTGRQPIQGPEHSSRPKTVTTTLRGRPRLCSALAFGSAGGLLSIAWWSPVIFAAGLREWALFVGAPATAAMIAGILFGRLLLSAPAVTRAALCGVLIGSVALLLFAPLFSAIYVFTHSAEGWDVPALAAIILIGSAVVIWWLVAIVSAAVATLLYCLCWWPGRARLRG